MSKNLISVVTEALGVGIEEEFRLKGVEGYKFFIDSRGYTQCFSIGTGRFDGEYTADYDLQYLLRNPDEIIKLPYNPKNGEEYWTYTDILFGISRETWNDFALDYIRKSAGVIFRNEKEAVAARPDKYKEFTGKEWKK